jgi:hypothetical protein
MGKVDGVPHPRPARGVLIPGGRRQLVIKLDSDTFDDVRNRASRDGVSVSHMLRLLIEWGLEADNA